jgi:hypothetical protein
MKSSIFLLFGLVPGLVSAAFPLPVQNLTGPRAEPAAKFIDVASFKMELQHLSDQLQKRPSPGQMEDLGKSLPSSWSVSDAGKTYTVSTGPLRAQLASGSYEKAGLWVRHLRDVVESGQEKGVSSEGARAQLERILAGPEFEASRPPGPLEMLRRRILGWLGRLLEKLFRGIARRPAGAETLFWLLLAGAVAFVAMMLFRFLIRRDSVETLEPAAATVAERSWQEWLRAARQAASRDDFREAVHSAYWAGIGRLEEIGAVPRDRSKTPREYLRLVANPVLKQTGSPTHPKAPLLALTSRLEKFWYADRAAGPVDFQESLQYLEELGCLLE